MSKRKMEGRRSNKVILRGGLPLKKKKKSNTWNTINHKKEEDGEDEEIRCQIGAHILSADEKMEAWKVICVTAF